MALAKFNQGLLLILSRYPSEQVTL